MSNNPAISSKSNPEQYSIEYPQQQTSEIPQAEWGIIGGSSTNSINFPEDLEDPRIHIQQQSMFFSTPYGLSPEFTYFQFTPPKSSSVFVLSCKMHGWRKGVSRAEASKQIFWVLQEARAKQILGEGGVGALNHLLNPRDLIIPTDYVDLSLRRDVNMDSPYLLIMRDPICPLLHQSLLEACQKKPLSRVFERGVYVVTDGRHFESRAEITLIRNGPGDVVGQSLCPEVYLAREIGACYAGLYIVVNHAEGVINDWDYQELKDIFFTDSKALGSLLLDSIQIWLQKNQPTNFCKCDQLRKSTLLKT